MNPYNLLNLIKFVINIHIWVKLYTYGRKYTHSGVNKSNVTIGRVFHYIGQVNFVCGPVQLKNHLRGGRQY